MKKIWNNISYLGIKNRNLSLDQRSTILTNQFNAILFGVILVLFIAIRFEGYIRNQPMGIGSLRLILLLFVTFINLVLAKFSWLKLSKFSLIYFTPFLGILLPTFLGFVEEESYVYYPFVIITLSIIPQMILPLDKERVNYFFALLYYLILMLFIDTLLNFFNPETSAIYKNISTFYYYYKLVSIAIFCFTCYSIFYLRSLNYSFERKLANKNKALDAYNEELKSTIDNLKATQKQLVHAEKMAALGNLTAGISHEINNPLNYVSGGLFLIEETIEKLRSNNPELNPEELSESLSKSSDMIEKGVRKAAQIVNLLTVFSLQKTTHKQSVKLPELIDGTLCFISIKANNKIDIRKEYNFVGEVQVHHDQIHQVILNIFNNAIDAIFLKPEEPQPYIFVKTYAEEINQNNYAVFDIFNTGIQIHNDHLLKIFEPFYSTKELNGNSGLGLSIAYSILKEHHGTIEAFNKENGVSFVIKLPVN